MINFHPRVERHETLGVTLLCEVTRLLLSSFHADMAGVTVVYSEDSRRTGRRTKMKATGSSIGLERVLAQELVEDREWESQVRVPRRGCRREIERRRAATQLVAAPYSRAYVR